MFEIHWLILAVIVTVSFWGGFFLCVILTMAKRSDEALEKMHQEWKEAKEDG